MRVGKGKIATAVVLDFLNFLEDDEKTGRYLTKTSEKEKNQITDSVVPVQDDRMGFHICIVGY